MRPKKSKTVVASRGTLLAPRQCLKTRRPSPGRKGTAVSGIKPNQGISVAKHRSLEPVCIAIQFIRPKLRGPNTSRPLLHRLKGANRNALGLAAAPRDRRGKAGPDPTSCKPRPAPWPAPNQRTNPAHRVGVAKKAPPATCPFIRRLSTKRVVDELRICWWLVPGIMIEATAP